ncbi:GLPGLI family protein [Maribacter confluentis]|uniref:GLPGLI family protein n=1 Tax=Maribacter confluentis TaxID=1656093 RepID=A0ABT8RK83_9FLAO|nr:GLPGLI family protein [Maribacter confluentis]MDO1511373.1 GLPGLI family protein [Maribacter confluentis]
MIKQFIYLILLVGYFSYAQRTSVAEYVYVNKIINYKSNGVLKFTSNHSNYTLLKSEALVEEERTLDENGNVQINLPDSDDRPEYYLNRELKIFLNKVYGFREVYILDEEIPNINWKIEKEFKNLNTLICQKATGYFRGRTYIVWFANDIPVPYGPWKLQGLPGLIVEATDDEGLILFRLSKYITQNQGENIQIPVGTKKMSLKEFVTKEKPEKQKEFFAYVSSLNTDRNTTIVSSSYTEPPGLELIYEWEKNGSNKE